MASKESSVTEQGPTVREDAHQNSRNGKENDHTEDAGSSKKSSIPGVYAWTDFGNAERLASKCANTIRYCPGRGWISYNAGRWTPGEHYVRQRAQEVIREAWREADLYLDPKKRDNFLKFRSRSENDSSISATLGSARTLDTILTKETELDRHNHLLNCSNGIVNLRTGEVIPHDPRLLITQQIALPYNSAATAPRWEQFLREIFAGNKDLIAFVQRAVGYSITGEIHEQVLFFCHGDGANGKTTFIDALLFVLGGYAGTTAPGLLMMRRADPHPTELADLQGKRLVVTSETAEEKRLDEEKVKRLTGGDPIKARAMRQDFFEFTPTHTFWLTSNYLPTIRGTDTGIWRRQRLIPFNVTFKDPVDARPGEPVKDLTLGETLRAEAEGILAWIVRGAVQWYEGGLCAPEAVMIATEEYRQEMDLIAQFIAECCKLGPKEQGASKVIYKAYEQWCREAGEERSCKSSNAFGRELTKRGYPLAKDEKTRIGIRALTPEEMVVLV